MSRKPSQVSLKDDNVKLETNKQEKISIDGENDEIETINADSKRVVDDVIDDTLSLNLEEGDQEKTMKEDSRTEHQTLRSVQKMSALHMEPLLTRQGTYVLTSATLKDRNLTVEDR